MDDWLGGACDPDFPPSFRHVKHKIIFPTLLPPCELSSSKPSNVPPPPSTQCLPPSRPSLNGFTSTTTLNQCFAVTASNPSNSPDPNWSKSGPPPNLAWVTLLMCSARQRTFEAAYWRTSLGQFSFALVILKIFQKEFYAIGGTFRPSVRKC